MGTKSEIEAALDDYAEQYRDSPTDIRTLDARRRLIALIENDPLRNNNHAMRLAVGQAIDHHEFNGDRKTIDLILRVLDSYDEANPDYGKPAEDALQTVSDMDDAVCAGRSLAKPAEDPPSSQSKRCSTCGGSGRTSSHAMGEIVCMACEGTGEEQP